MNAASLVALCKAKGLTVTTAESCTGGMVAAAITAIPGSSAIFGFGFVTYANAAKTQLLGVPEAMLAEFGAVCAPVALAMAAGAKRAANADIAVAITGIAGPDGGSAAKPVGTVWFGLAGRDEKPAATHQLFAGSREEVRQAAASFALKLLWEEAGR